MQLTIPTLPTSPRDAWVPLAEPVEAFFFDFTDAIAHMAPAQVPLRLQFTAAGVFNAVALWFDLHLDEESMLRWGRQDRGRVAEQAGVQNVERAALVPACRRAGSCVSSAPAEARHHVQPRLPCPPALGCSTNPYTDKGPTWQQAVQWVREVEVAPGQELELTASHDTYSISFALPPDLHGGASGASGLGNPMQHPAAADGAETNSAATAAAGSNAAAGPRPTGVPLVDPAWRAAHDQLQGLNSQLVKACVQNPLEYRAVALAALQFAARPHDLGLDAQQAAEFCVKTMG